MKLCRQKWLLIVIGLIYFITFLIIFPLVCTDLVYSPYRSSYWNKQTLRANASVLHRLAAFSARKYIQELRINKSVTYLDSTNLYSDFSSDAVDLAIVVVTVRRIDSTGEEVGYLTRVMSVLDRLMKSDRRFWRKTLDICNVYSGPGRHKEALGMADIFSVISRFQNGSISASIMDPFEKERQDYIFCARWALRHNPSMVLIVEDDAEPREDLFPALHHVLSLKSGSDSARSWTLIKLYFPERWLGYSNELATVMELFAIAIIGGLLFILIGTLIMNKRGIRSSVYYLLFLSGCIYFILIALSIGRQHLLILRSIILPISLAYSLAPVPACCTPAVLYQSASLQRLVDALDLVECSSNYPLDVAMWKVISASHRTNDGSVHYDPSYLVQPNLFRHIGLVSTMKGISNFPEDFML